MLFLHGQPGSARDWNAVVSAIGPRAETIAFDRPGWDGRTPAGGLAVSARAAAAVLHSHDVERATVVGLSFGGGVAARMALDFPERVAALVLVSPAANTASLALVDRLLAAPVAGYAASAALLAGAGWMLGSGWVRRRLQEAFSFPDDYLRGAAGRLRTRAVWDSFFIEQRALLRDLPDLEARLHEITAPTTIVIGTADTILPAAAGRTLARQIPRARLVEIEGGHHVLPAEHPERLADEILLAAAVARREVCAR